jgi:cell division control protein 45
VLILLTSSVDSLCALGLITDLLKGMCILYSVKFVTSVPTLKAALSGLPSDANGDGSKVAVNTVLCLNCALSVNVPSLLPPPTPKSLTKVYIFDSRRPVNLTNVHHGGAVLDNPKPVLLGNMGNVVACVMPEITGDEWEGVSDGEGCDGDENEEDSSDDDSSDDDDDDSEQEEDAIDYTVEDEGEEEATFDDVQDARKRRKVIDDDDEDEEEEEEKEKEEGDADADDDNNDGEENNNDGEEGDNQSDANPQDDGGGDDDDDKSATTTPPAASPVQNANASFDPMKHMSERKSRITAHYASGSHHAIPTSYVIHQLILTTRSRDSLPSLWMAAVGVTSCLLTSSLSTMQYNSLTASLSSIATKLKPLQETFMSNNTVVATSRKGEVIPQDEYRLYLLNNWSFYESLLHSNYCFAKLELHKSRDKMHELMAKMGVPLSEAKQPYAFMKPQFRNTLKTQLLQYSKDYDLTDLTFKGFTLVTGFNSTITASDVVYAMMAIMDTGATENDMARVNMALDCMSTSGSSKEGSDLNNLVNGGNVGQSGLSYGISIAKTNQQAIMSAAISLVEKSAIVTYKHFRFAYLHATSAGVNSSSISWGGANGADQTAPNNPFANPNVLHKLSSFLMEMHRATGKWANRKAKPLILLAEVPQTQSYIVSAYNCPESRNAVTRNHFGDRFEQAAKRTGREGEVSVKCERFDDWVVEVPMRLVTNFIQQLHLVMEA